LGRARHGSRNGASLIEVLIGITIFALISTAVYLVYVLTVRAERTSMSDAELLDGARRALAVVAEQVRMAGLDPTGTGQFGFKEITGTFRPIAAENNILFSIDANADGSIGAGMDERVGFVVVNTELVRTTNGTSAVAGVPPIAKGVTSFKITYRDASNNTIPSPLTATYTLTAAQRSSIRRIEFELSLSKQAGAFGTRAITVKTDVRSRNL
jgi:type IV pilus assembly protein PilW